MNRRPKRLVLLMVLAILGGLIVLPTTQAQAARTYEVQVGRFLFDTAPAESMRFFPSRIRVHKGDILRFTTDGFHTATLLPTGEVPEEWVDDYARRPVQPYAFIQRDPDEGRRGFKVNTRAAFPSRFDCGGPGQPACNFDGSGGPVRGVLNSGLPFAGPVDMSVRITADPGDTIWALCLVHTKMTMRIDVVPDDRPASKPSNLDARNTKQEDEDADLAASLHTKLKDRQTSHVTRSGKRVWDAFAGYDSGGVSLFDMYPNKLSIKKGQRVRWHFSDLRYETHSATFPSERGDAIARNLGAPKCDPDGDDGPGPDTDPTQPPPNFCDDPGQLELDLPLTAIFSVGNNRHTSRNDFEHSGFRGADAPTDDSYNLKFEKVSKGTPFVYNCAIHPFMVGKVSVKPKS